MAALTETVAEAIALVDADLVLDLSEVQFMGAATIGVIIEARNLLGLRSRSLTLRSPSPFARRILELCGVADLIDPARVEAARIAGPADALGTWVAVPATARADGAANEPEPAPGGVPRPVPTGHASTPSQVPSLDHHLAEEHGTTLAASGGP